jgi:hypothetical protein
LFFCSPVIASEAIHSFFSRRYGLLPFRGDMDCFASLAMTALEKAARAALGDRWKPRALWKEEVGSPLFSADVNAVTSDVD